MQAKIPDGPLSKTVGICGLNERYSVADIALYAYTHVAHQGDYDLSPYVHIDRWLSDVSQQPRHITIDA